ncbi:MAG: sensor histidine kinase response regulator [Deltaproteobacteria bacterium]|nr:sensor histidine kinase response regulator [Deltaproteobacteria bacterium]
MTNNNSGMKKTIHAIFSPAIALLNRLNYTRKFTLLWLISLVAISVVMYSLFASLHAVIQPSKRELQGLVLMEPIFRTVQFIQQHRGLSAALLGGNEAMRDRRAAKELEVAEAFRAMEKEFPPGLTSSEAFQYIKAEWERLRKEGLHWTVDENLATHTRLIEQIQLFKLSVADDYLLTLDWEIATYYQIDTAINKLPHALERLGQLRAYGTGILAKRQITESQKIKLNVLIAEYNSSLRELRGNIEKVGHYNPAVRESLLTAVDSIADLARQVVGLVTSDILSGRFATPPEAFLGMATAAIDKGYAQLHDSMLPATQTLIKARIARAENTLLVSVSSALLLLLLVVYISVSIYYAIIGSIKSLVHSAHTFAEGDLSQRVKLSTRDELSQIGDSFNRMAEGFNALLEERKQAEQALSESEKLYRSLFENILNGFAYCQMIFEQDQPQDFIYLNVNAAFETQTGLKNVVGKRVSEVSPGIRLSDPKLLEIYGRVSLSGKPERFEIYLNALRQWFWMSVYSPEKGYFVAVFDVITERKQAEKELRNLYHAVEQSPVSIFITDAAFNIEYINPKFIEITGYSREEVIGKKPDIVSSGTAMISDTEWRGEFLAKKKNGDPFWEYATISPIRNAQGVITNFIGIHEDVTERRKLEDQLRHSQKLEALGQLVGGIAHDFNNMLTAIIGFAGILEMKMKKDDPLIVNVEQVIEAAKRGASLTSSLLVFGRKQAIFPRPLNLNEIIEKVEKLLLRLIGEDIELKTVILDKELNVTADPLQIEQVLINLATNARDAMSKEGVLTIETSREEIDRKFINSHGYGEIGEYALISVSDTGAGMDEKIREKVFEPFFTTKEVGKGTGLGLAIVYGIVKQHNGYITVYSELGKGTTFKIYLPMTKPVTRDAAPVETAASTASATGTETVLVAEDDKSVMKLSKTLLETFGYTVIEAVNGEEAVQKYMENKDMIKLLILDVIMPKKNGREAYEEIKKITPEARAIFMSGYTADIMHTKGIIENGMVFISKPISPTDFIKKVREVLDR